VALAAIAFSCIAVAVLWTLVALLDERVTFSPRTIRVTNAVGLGVVVAAVAVGAFALSSVDVGAKWRNFKAGYPAESGGSHFSIGLGSNRYDFWRVAVHEFRRQPLHGVGADNFANDYVRERRSSEEPLYPHSLALRIPAQFGVVGCILFLGFVVAAGLAVTRGSGFADGVARAGVAAAVYYGIHGSGDWLWEFAGLGAPAFAWLGLAGSTPTVARRSSLPLRLGGVAVALAIAVSFVFPWLAELEVRRAARIWPNDRVAAFRALDRARRLNPLSARADLLAGAIASRVDDPGRMADAFEAAVARSPHDWYAHLELALAYDALGQRHRALAALAVSKQLNPGEEAIRSVRREMLAGRRVNRNQIDRLFVERVRSRVGP